MATRADSKASTLAPDSSNNSKEQVIDNEAQPKEQPQASPSQPTVPNGGKAAWLTVLGCFLAFFVAFGFVISFGVFQAYYESILPDYSSSDISWIGSFQLWLLLSMSIPSVILNAHAGPHVTLGVGTFFIVFGVMMASLSTQYYQFLLSHGICCGIGIGLVFLPIIGLPNQWFTTRRGVAVGLAMGGSSIGGVIWPVMANQLLNYDHIGYPWTMRAIGFLQLAIMGIAIALIRTNVPRNKAVKLSSFPFKMAFKSPGVDLFALGLLLHFFGVYIPFFYASVYAQSLGASAYIAFYVSAVLNATTFFGRFIMGGLADKYGHTNVLVLSVFVSGILAFAWSGVNSVAGIFVWSAFYGWFGGASTSLQSPAAIPLVPNKNKLALIGPYIAIVCEVSSFGALAGSPVAGALLRRSVQDNDTSLARPQDFHGMMWFTGSMLFASIILYQAARYTHTPNFLTKA